MVLRLCVQGNNLRGDVSSYDTSIDTYFQKWKTLSVMNWSMKVASLSVTLEQLSLFTGHVSFLLAGVASLYALSVRIVLIPCMYSNQVILFSSVSVFKCRADKSCTFTSLTPLNGFSPHSLLTFHAPSLPATHPFEFCTLAVRDTFLTVYRTLLQGSHNTIQLH